MFLQYPKETALPVPCTYRFGQRAVLNAICNTAVGITDSTDMKDNAFQSGFWEAPENLLGIICDALGCPAVFLVASW